MFDSETRWFVRCDTCPDDAMAVCRSVNVNVADKDRVTRVARSDGWAIRDGLHRCPRCVREGRGLSLLGGTETAR